MNTPSALAAPGSRAPVRLQKYPLAALQSAMLVNHLRAPRSGVDIVQMVCALPEHVHIESLRAAWELISTRHDVLRTVFHWEGVAEPQQEVLESAPPPLTVLDWSTLGDDEVPAALREFLATDRTRGFDLAAPPLQRVALMRVRDDDWRMVWTFHHILLDGRSFPMVLREVFAEYEASLEGRTIAPMARRPFSEFVEWYTGQDFSKTEAFWRERMQGIPGPTPIPAAFHDIGRQPTAGRGLHARLLNAQSTAALEQLARANGLTMNNIVQGAWSLLLARHSGESDVVFGATRACRKNTVADADDMVGMFINTVPVRVTVRPDMPLVAWLGELREGWRKLFEAEHTPLRLVQRWSDAGPQTPLFDTQIVFENLPLDVTLQMDGGKMASRAFHLYGGTNFALTALVFGGRELSLEIENERARIDDVTAVRLLDHLACLFEAMAANPAAAVGALSMLPDAERELVVNAWNRTATPYPEDATLVSLMRDQVARTPDAIAVSDSTCTLTFAELDRRSRALAGELRTRGVTAGVLVGVCAERSAELVVALVAVVKAGAAYVPIDPEYPADRVAFMLEDAGVPVLLAQQRVAQALPPHAAQIVLLDGVADALWVDPTSARALPLPVPAPDHSAYMIYTSGSTGRPKGARNAHRGIVNRLLWMQGMYGLTAHDVVLQKTPFSFDVSVWEFFWPLIAGATLVMAKPGGHKDSGYLASTISQHRVTVCHFVPSMLRAFLADSRAAGCGSLRDVMASGEALPADLVALFNTTLPNATLHNLYGPTECAVDVTYWECPKQISPTAVVPIGRPVANTRVHVLDEHAQPVAVGVPGELYLAGVQVGQGYHNRAELTAERFVVDTLSDEVGNRVPRGARLYRTGDRARWRPDGTVEYLGRLDFQVKIRGFRIELGEIENALLAHESVHDAVVVAYREPGATSAESKRLVAYIVSGDGTQPAAALRAALAEQLPDYMVPAIFVWLPALPLSSNGKVDRRALPAPEVERQSLSRAFVAPRTTEETVLADIWKATLKVSDVGVDDNFFELGGDSLLGVQILARAAQRGLRITLSELLRTPTVAALARAAGAQWAASQSQDAGARAQAALLRVEVAGDVPLTPVQHWFFEHQGANPHHWNQAFLFEVPANTSDVYLANAVEAVIEQHDSLRLRFEYRDGQWVQYLPARVNRASDATGADGSCAEEFSRSGDGCTVVDFSGSAGTDREEQLSRLCARLQASLSITAGPLLRVALVRFGPSEPARVLIVAHHLAVDGVSWRVLREDLDRAYEHAARNTTMAHTTHGTPFSAWSRATATLTVVDAMAHDLAYWVNAGAPGTVHVPTDAAAGAGMAADASTLAVCLTRDETSALFQRVPAAYNTQINDVLLAALADALHRWLGDGEFIVNLEGHGREDIVAVADVSQTTGWFTTIFPVRLPLQRATPGNRLKAVKELLREVPARGLSYGMLRYLAHNEVLRAQPTPPLVFNYLGQFDQVVSGSQLFSFAKESTGSWYGADTPRPHLLEVNALVLDGQLELRWSFNTRTHHRTTIEHVANEYGTALRELIAHCTAPDVRGYTPSDFPLATLDQASLDGLAASCGAIEDIYPLTPMQELFLGSSGPAGDAGFEQWRYRISGPLDVPALRKAWDRVVQRHAILRTAFVADDGSRPLQVVSKTATLQFTELDWRDVSSDKQAATLHQFLKTDREAGFDVERAPLMRVAVLRLAEAEYEFVWSNHHLLLDRWSWPIILQELQHLYPAIAGGTTPNLADAPRFADFVEWQHKQPVAVAQEFWTRHFAGYEPQPRLPLAYADTVGTEAVEVTAHLSAQETVWLQTFARSQQVALNSVIEAAWALTLARQSGHADTAFGVAVAGRDAKVAGIDQLVGLTINNLPLRVRVDASASVADWLRGVHQAQAEQQQFAHVTLAAVQQFSQVPWRSRLFETLLVFQHDDAEARTANWLGESVRTTLQHVPTETAYPLSVMVTGRDALVFRLTFDARYFTREDAQSLAGALRVAVMSIAHANRLSVGEVLEQLPRLERAITISDTASAHFVAPNTATETVLARIWSEVLGVERVGIHDDFFRLGGYSLAATQIVSRVRTTLKADVPIRLLFQHPTVTGFATAMTACEKKPGQLERVAQVVQRVQSMSLDELRRANAARAATN